MGIKFLCPNGHKLNVKAFLAGKRGVCPKCGERFDIPTTSGGQVVSKGHKRAKSGEAADAPMTAQPVVASTAPREPLSSTPDAFWYVRPTTGGQFGPAAANIMRQWIDEGRVAADSMVWQDGWETWRNASDVFEQFGAVASRAGALPPSPTLDDSDLQPMISDHGALGARRRKSLPALPLILIGVVVVLAIVFAIVVANME